MTIKDLARLSGYSVGTVSRALNGLPNVSEQARSAILALAQERGYQLNTNAKYLKQIHSSGIVAVVTGTSNELFAQMIERIQQTLPTDRYPLTVDYVDENEDPVERALHLSREKKPAGLLFLGGDRRMYAKSFGEITLPSVVLTTDAARLGFDNLSSVTTDDVEAAECAMEYLLESGHRRIGVIAGDLSCSGPSRLRYEGCLLALERCGLTLPDECCATARYAFQDGYDAALRLRAARELRGGAPGIGRAEIKATPHNSPSAFAGHFSPIHRFEKFEILRSRWRLCRLTDAACPLRVHKVFLHFSNLVPTKNLSPNDLVELCGVALIIAGRFVQCQSELANRI